MGSKTKQPKPTRQQAVDRLLAQLPTMDRTALQHLWRNLFDHTLGRSLRRETLIPILAYGIQEQAFGGLKESIGRRLRALAEDRPGGIQTSFRPKIDTHYVREYQGKMHEITVLDSGYEYESKTYRSLTEVAKVITGTKWSGPARGVSSGCI